MLRWAGLIDRDFRNLGAYSFKNLSYDPGHYVPFTLFVYYRPTENFTGGALKLEKDKGMNANIN